MGPFGERVIRALRKAKLVIGREKLLRMIEPARAVELFGADDAKRLKQFTADKIHAAFPSCGGEVCGACALSSSEPCQQRAVFVIWMRSGVKHAANHIQPLERLRQTHGTAVFGDFGARRNHGGNCGQHNDDPQEDFRSSKPHSEIPLISLRNCTSISWGMAATKEDQPRMTPIYAKNISRHRRHCG